MGKCINDVEDDLMNILILSAGTRNKLVQYFKKAFKDNGKVVCTDLTEYAPAIYDADIYYIVPPISDKNYIQTILDICKKENIDGIISLIDPELELLAENKSLFEDIGTKLILSPESVVKSSFDKYEFYKELKEKKFNSQKTYLGLKDTMEAINKNELTYPVFVKPNTGSASLNIQKVSDAETLSLIYSNSQKELITQEFINGKEYGIDVYIDLISKKVISIFIKEKLKMRAGETDKSIAVKNDEITKLVKDFVETMGYLGPIDIDLFEQDGKYYISEVNPRFGGGYLHAYLAGCDFPMFILNNLKGIINDSKIDNYESGSVMMKYNEVKLLEA